MRDFGAESKLFDPSCERNFLISFGSTFYLGDAVVVTNEQGIIEFTNRSMQLLYHYSNEELIGEVFLSSLVFMPVFFFLWSFLPYRLRFFLSSVVLISSSLPVITFCAYLTIAYKCCPPIHIPWSTHSSYPRWNLFILHPCILSISHFFVPHHFDTFSDSSLSSFFFDSL